MRLAVRLPWVAGVLAVSPALAQDDQEGPEVVDLRGQWSQFASTVVAGEGEGESRYGGRLDGYAQIDGEQAGIAEKKVGGPARSLGQRRHAALLAAVAT